jgi:iron complex transport system substrate-binding protein
MHSGNKMMFALVFLVVLFSGCTGKGTGRGPVIPEPIRVTDFTGNHVELEMPPERVVCLIESALSGIYMLGMESRVIAIPGDVYKNPAFGYYARLDGRIADKSFPAPGNWDFISIEQVLGMKPDLVILWSAQADVAAKLEQFDIAVYRVMIHNFNDVYKEISDFGKLFGCSERADSLIRITRQNLEQARAGSENKDTVTAYFMWAQGINETSGKNSTVEELLKFAGTRNVCDMEQEHVTISLEKLIEWNPEMIVMWYNEKLSPADILENPILQGIDAVRNRKVFELPDKFTCDFWTLKMQYPVMLINAWAYPENAGIFNGEDYFRALSETLYNEEPDADK